MNAHSTSKDISYKRKRSVTYCFVPKCPTNSIKFPEKLFLTVPQEPKLRERWMKVARRQHLPSPKSVLRCCEDHFDLENDVENWIKYKLVGGNLILKKDVVPHYFDCQQRMQITKPRSVVLKRKRQEILQSIENEHARKLESPSCQENTEQDIPKIDEKLRDQCTQVAIYPYKRSKAVQVYTRTPRNNVAVSPKKVLMKHRMISPLHISTYHLIYSDSDNDTRISNIEVDDEKGTSGSVTSDLSDQEVEHKSWHCNIIIKNIVGTAAWDIQQETTSCT